MEVGKKVLYDRIEQRELPKLAVSERSEDKQLLWTSYVIVSLHLLPDFLPL